MKTEDLKAQGLTDEQISFVMAENGKDLKKLQEENENLTSDRDASASGSLHWLPVSFPPDRHRLTLITPS